MFVKEMTLMLLIIGTSSGCKSPMNSSRASSVMFASKYSSFINETFLTPRALLHCDSMESTSAVTTSSTEPDAFFIEFSPTKSLLDENCYIAISADLKPGHENTVKWLATGPASQNLLFISSLEKVTVGKVFPYVHFAHYYQMFDIADAAGATTIPSSN